MSNALMTEESPDNYSDNIALSSDSSMLPCKRVYEESSGCETPAKKANTEPRFRRKATRANLAAPTFEKTCFALDNDSVGQVKLVSRADRVALREKENDNRVGQVKLLARADRIALKEKGKGDLNRKKVDAQHNPVDLKDNAEEIEARIESIGNQLQASLRVVWRDGSWSIPDSGVILVPSVRLGLFHYMFKDYLAKMKPSHFHGNIDSVNAVLGRSDVCKIFGVNNVSGGNDVVTYGVNSMSVSFQPRTQELLLSYSCSGFQLQENLDDYDCKAFRFVDCC